MRAAAGDRLVVKSERVGQSPRGAEILAVKGEDGAPPYTVRWEGDGHVGLFFPGPDVVVEHYPMVPEGS